MLPWPRSATNWCHGLLSPYCVNVGVVPRGSIAAWSYLRAPLVGAELSGWALRRDVAAGSCLGC